MTPPHPSGPVAHKWIGGRGRALAAVAALLLAACGGPRESDPLIRPPVAYRPWTIADVPMPPGYTIDDVTDQLAITFAGGKARRMACQLQQIDPDRSFAADKLLLWYGQVLPGQGWRPVSEQMRDRSQVWRKDRADGVSETLRLETGRARKRAIIRIFLVPGLDT